VFPLRDVIPSRTTPWITLSLIVANALVFLHMVGLDAHAREQFVFSYGLIPASFSWVSAVTSLFLHAGWIHVIGNLWSLWIFGDNVEDRMGHGRFLVFYLLAGLVAALAQTYFLADAELPLVGASGAIAGVMGAYIVLFPQSRILVLIFLVIVVDVIEVSAVFFLAFWFLLQLVSGVGQLAHIAGAQVGFWAHIGGFLTGIIAVWGFRRRERLGAEWWGA
jgi:membrane associated rhomboid family serine protease